MLKRLMQILCLLPIFAAGSAYAVTCQSNEFEYNGECIESKFEITTTNDTNKFVFNMSAKGTFYIDWGDGNVQMINRTGTTMTEYTHNYASANEYIIKFGGRATGYSTTASAEGAPTFSCVYFGSNYSTSTHNTYLNIAAISGSLGAIFQTIGSGGTNATQPRFSRTFHGCSNLKSSIPTNLFKGISGAPVSYMFFLVFTNSGFTGSIPEDLFGRVINGEYQGINGNGANRMFHNLFSGCKGLTGSIPGNLFGRVIDGVYYGIKKFENQIFLRAFYNCSGLTGSIPANLFSNISGETYANMFQETFYDCSGLTGTNIDDPNNSGMKYAIPPTLFSGISGAPTSGMFNGTFRGCSGLNGTIPGSLFSGISGKPATNMFNNTFQGCSGLTGSIPGNLFSGISGKPATNMFYNTFYGCSGLTGTDIDDPDQPGYKYAIPPTLFSGLSGAPATYMFYGTFRGCSGLNGTIPGNLFSGVSGAPATYMFSGTFTNCSGLTGSIPGNLFSGVSGAPASNMFYETFYGCSGLGGTDIDDPDQPGYKYAIPPTLFSGISGAPADSMFNTTFYNCSGLSGTIPGNLFAGISGAPAYAIFNMTFRGCSNLTGSIPASLFAGIVGKPTQYMFYTTFGNCSKLTGPIPPNLFAGIIGKGYSDMFTYTFNGCTNLGKDRIGGTSTYYIPPELFAGIDKTSVTSGMMTGVFGYTGLLTTCPSGTNQYITGFESWFGGKKSCTQCSVNYPNYNTTNDQCYAQITYIDSDNNTLLKTEDIYYDANYPNGYTLPSYSPTKPDTILDNWENGSGTVIAANDVLTGNQVLYSDWGFNCDSGRHFHIANEQVCVAESKRTEHALVIQYDPEHTYYIHATPNSEHDYTINSSSIHKLKANYNGTIYNLHDASVYFSE